VTLKIRTKPLLLAMVLPALVLVAALARADAPPPQGLLVFTDILPDGSQELFTSAPDGSGRQSLTDIDGVSAFDARWAPNGDRLVYVVKTAEQNTSIRVLDRRAGQDIVVTEGFEDYDPSWSPDGREVVFVRHVGFQGAIQVSTLSVATVGRSGVRDLLLLDGGSRYLRNPAWSPDGQRIAFEVRQAAGGADVYLLRLADGSLERLRTPAGWDDVEPSWSPTGRYLAFASGPGGEATDRSRHALWLADLQGDDRGSLLVDEARDLRRPAWSPDERFLVFDAAGEDGRLRLRSMDWRSARPGPDLGSGFQADWGRLVDGGPSPTPPAAAATPTDIAPPTPINTGTPIGAPTVPVLPTLVPFPTFPPAEPPAPGPGPTFPLPSASPTSSSTPSPSSVASPTSTPSESPAGGRIWLPMVLGESILGESWR
jgi:dipeptidyl aminopeptidase/acylaminoacyl peptidase